MNYVEDANKNRGKFHVDTPDLLGFPFCVSSLGSGATRHRLGPLHVSEQLDESEFVELLNEWSSKPTSSAGQMSRLPTARSASEILREWVDEWIASGVSAGGVEKPSERMFQQEGNLRLIVFEYSKRNRISLIATGAGLNLSFDPYERNDGRPRLFGLPNEGIAREKLVFFLLSELRFRLAKCRRDGCGRYFVLSHWKRTYKRGTFCPDCQRVRSLESASRATLGDRSTAQKKLTNLAGRRFAKKIRVNPDWSQDKALRGSIVQFLNDQIKRDKLLRSVYFGAGRHGITSKWLSHAKNRNAIEAIAKGAN